MITRPTEISICIAIRIGIGFAVPEYVSYRKRRYQYTALISTNREWGKNDTSIFILSKHFNRLLKKTLEFAKVPPSRSQGNVVIICSA